MKITLLQHATQWMAADANRRNAEEWIERCADSHLVVLPEMFTTGFCTEPRTMQVVGGGAPEREISGATSLEWMQRMAARYCVTLAGSVAMCEEGDFYNRLFFVRPDGTYASYDKRHLFTFAGEDHHYRAGAERVVVEVEGARILLLICYDLRFPVWSRNRGDYDVILCVAAWPSSRRAVWDLLLRARAIENVSYVCGVNMVGSDPAAQYSGGTAAIDFAGNIVAQVADNEQGAATFELDMGALEAFRSKFPALSDADDFEIK
ncbi:MAG: amidohydrolase [Rikenellaceae bacterium]